MLEHGLTSHVSSICTDVIMYEFLCRIYWSKKMEQNRQVQFALVAKMFYIENRTKISTIVYIQVVGEAKNGELCGEIGVLCYRPQLFTVRTKRLCQLLRLNRTTFLNIIQANVGDGTIIMNNLLKVCFLYNNP